MSDRQIGEKTKVLMRAKSLIEDERNWCQGTYQDKDGRVCAMAALVQITGHPLQSGDSGGQYHGCMELLSAAAFEESKSFLWGSPICFPTALNDLTDHSTVMRMYDRAITLAMKEQRQD